MGRGFPFLHFEHVRQWLAAHEASPAETDCDFEDRNTEGPSPGRRCPCCGGRMIIVETFDDARAPRARHRRPGSGSTPHDHRGASRLAMLIAFASPRAPEQERDVLTTSADNRERRGVNVRKGECAISRHGRTIAEL